MRKFNLYDDVFLRLSLSRTNTYSAMQLIGQSASQSARFVECVVWNDAVYSNC